MTTDELFRRLDDLVTAVERIALASERRADVEEHLLEMELEAQTAAGEKQKEGCGW